MDRPPLSIGLLAFPRLTQLDMTGPFEAFARIPRAKVHVIWKTLEPVVSDVGLSINPTVTIEHCPDLDVICIPGGPGQVDVMDDAEVIDFVRERGGTAQWVTSVCTGALVLGAAGLLRGYKATTHWASMDNLELFGAEPVRERIVVDRNRITGGGITAGIDFGLFVAKLLAGEQAASEIQLFLEYDPAPPLNAGSPDTAPRAVVDSLLQRIAPMLERRKAASQRAAARLAQATPA